MMPSIQVYFNGSLKETVELTNEVTTVGRKEKNDIRINNPGVSGCHAKILREGDEFIIVDGHSTNGTYVNGEQVNRMQLKYGDTITIFKHSLKFSALVPQQERVRLVGQEITSAPQNGTVAVDLSYLNEMLKQQHQGDSAYLLVNENNHQQKKRQITSSIFKIGKGSECNLRLPGWLAPRVAASIKRKTDGFYITPTKRGKVCINGLSAVAETRLKDGDNLDIRNMSSIFYLSPIEGQSGK